MDSIDRCGKVLATKIAWAIKARHLTPEAAADALGIDQVEISKITHGQFRVFSEARMLELVAKLVHRREQICSKPR
ncbi:XRE family transcriptional regulator [Rhodoferax sp. 4810]|nr:XRE family transcriptional regulator [Rhodoferax jenense]